MWLFIKENFWITLIIINYVIAISAVITILLKNVNPTRTLSYIIALVFFPFLGLIIYYLFGQEYRKDKIFNRKNILNQTIIKNLGKDLEADYQIFKRENGDVLDDKIKLVKLLRKSEKSPLTISNKVQIIKNGEEKFKLLLEDLKQAKDHIHLEYYIIRDDRIGTKVIDVLCEKAQNGVKVRLNIDDVGSSLTKKTKQRLKDCGVELYSFMPVLFSGFTGKMNYRNHRKIAIVDGKIGYLGGINIEDEYVNDGNNDVFWRDTHLRLEGEAVQALQVHFLINWEFVSDCKLKITKNFFPKVTIEEEIAVQIAASGPDTDWANIMEVIFTAIVTAEKYVYITTPYFIPNDQIITAMQVASKSGVDVRLLLPKESDAWITKHASDSYLQDLLDADVKVYQYKKGFIHSKTLVVDDTFSSIGTSNMDYRSFNINFEINAMIYNKKLSLELKQHFIDDLNDSEQVESSVWKKRPKLKKLKESYSRLWAPLL
uniref:cardiolipin synthase n=1 Tax=Gelidibacter sp. TaxID=2018083 RepID=UPI00404A8DC0